MRVECECEVEGPGCFAKNKISGLHCTRLENHLPPHVACSNARHNIDVWLGEGIRNGRRDQEKETQAKEN